VVALGRVAGDTHRPEAKNARRGSQLFLGQNRETYRRLGFNIIEEMKAKHSTQTQRSRDDYAGNRVSQGSLNLANLLVENSSHKFVPDEFGTGSLAQKVDRVSGAAENFSYRADQKLTSYSRDGMQAEYFYDALGRRVAKKITKGAEPVFTQSYVYLGEEDKILLGKSGDGEITVYLDGQGIDEHLGEVSSRGAKAYATDHLGSVLNGEAAGAAKAFGAWGENLNGSSHAINASSAPVVYGYTGRQLDPESASYYYRARTYLPEVGRFAQPDPIGFDGGDVNLYRYVENNPLSNADPLGLYGMVPMPGPMPIIVFPPTSNNSGSAMCGGLGQLGNILQQQNQLLAQQQYLQNLLQSLALSSEERAKLQEQLKQNKTQQGQLFDQFINAINPFDFSRPAPQGPVL